jgi:hypothetical protein
LSVGEVKPGGASVRGGDDGVSGCGRMLAHQRDAFE